MRKGKAGYIAASLLAALTMSMIYSQSSEAVKPTGQGGLPYWSRIINGSNRFELVMGGEAVLDHETGLVWEQTPSAALLQDQGYWWGVDWNSASRTCYDLEKGGRFGWRMPSVVELTSIVDRSPYHPGDGVPTLPIGHPFNDVLLTSNLWWTSTPSTEYTSGYYAVDLLYRYGGALAFPRTNTSISFIWCVRGGK